MEFSSIEELKQRIMPALKIRERELRKKGYGYTTEDIWNYFVRIWKNSHNLTLADLVDDILNHGIDKN